MEIEEKTRRLKKYEADHIPVMGTDDMDLYSPFGPMIAHTTISEEIIQIVNDYADEYCDNENGTEFILPAEIVFDQGSPSLATQLEQHITQYVEAVDDTAVKQVQLDTAWVVSQFENTASPMHFHSSAISGVMYLKTPEVDIDSDERNYISGRRTGAINFMSGGKQPLNKSLVSFQPNVGDCFIFPGWLLHGVEPFSGNGERRSLAFNATVVLDDGKSMPHS